MPKEYTGGVKHLLIIGAGGYGREVYNRAHFCNGYGTDWDVKGFLDDTQDPLGGYEGYAPIIGKIHEYVPQEGDVFICAIGSVLGKKECVNTLLAKGGKFINLIHKDAVMDRNLKMGIGCIIDRTCRVSCDITIGNFVTLQAECMLGHDATVGDWCHLHPRVFMGGKSVLDEGVHVGYGAFIHPGMRVQAYAKVGAGAYVFNNVRSGKTVMGNPARSLE